MSIGAHLQFAINECISKNVFPDVLKKAYVIRIYKKGGPLEAEIYRPISVTPTLAKIFERLLLPQMLEHVEKYEIINNWVWVSEKKIFEWYSNIVDRISEQFVRRKRNRC